MLFLGADDGLSDLSDDISVFLGCSEEDGVGAAPDRRYSL